MPVGKREQRQLLNGMSLAWRHVGLLVAVHWRASESARFSSSQSLAALARRLLLERSHFKRSSDRVGSAVHTKILVAERFLGCFQEAINILRCVRPGQVAVVQGLIGHENLSRGKNSPKRRVPSGR